nr:C-type lectin BfL-2-like [Aedes albopictus]
MRLASIENKAKSDAIEKFVRGSDKFANVSRLWIGASDLAEEGTFTWIHNGDFLAYTHWNEREPNNKDREEHCVELTHHTGTWFWNDMNSIGQATASRSHSTPPVTLSPTKRRITGRTLSALVVETRAPPIGRLSPVLDIASPHRPSEEHVRHRLSYYEVYK